jgi:cellobiose-specific phosphotransferase system component IIB
MKVLVICVSGLSSSILASNLRSFAVSKGDSNFFIETGSVEEIARAVKADNHEKFDVILVAPQVANQKNSVVSTVAPYHIPLIFIASYLYTPNGINELYDNIIKLIQKVDN